MLRAHISAVSIKFPPRLTNSSRILCERASSHWMPNVIVPAQIEIPFSDLWVMVTLILTLRTDTDVNSLFDSVPTKVKQELGKKGTLTEADGRNVNTG